VIHRENTTFASCFLCQPKEFEKAEIWYTLILNFPALGRISNQATNKQNNYKFHNQSKNPLHFKEQVHNCVQESLPLVILFSQINPVCKAPPPATILFLDGAFQHCPSLGSPSGIFPSGFPIKTIYAPLHTPHATPFPFIFHPLSNKSYIKFHLMVNMKLVSKMVFDGTAHYK
jgi:hypothetical protein